MREVGEHSAFPQQEYDAERDATEATGEVKNFSLEASNASKKEKYSGTATRWPHCCEGLRPCRAAGRAGARPPRGDPCPALPGVPAAGTRKHAEGKNCELNSFQSQARD